MAMETKYGTVIYYNDVERQIFQNGAEPGFNHGLANFLNCQALEPLCLLKTFFTPSSYPIPVLQLSKIAGLTTP